jgi:hypothetical protein
MWLTCIDCKREFEAKNRKRKKPELIGNSMFQSSQHHFLCYLHWLASGHDAQLKTSPRYGRSPKRGARWPAGG